MPGLFIGRVDHGHLVEGFESIDIVLLLEKYHSPEEMPLLVIVLNARNDAECPQGLIQLFLVLIQKFTLQQVAPHGFRIYPCCLIDHAKGRIEILVKGKVLCFFKQLVNDITHTFKGYLFDVATHWRQGRTNARSDGVFWLFHVSQGFNELLQCDGGDGRCLLPGIVVIRYHCGDHIFVIDLKGCRYGVGE